MEDKAISVTQLSMYIKQIFDAEELLFNINVVGEISGISIVRGVVYFTLKDENASLSCVCFNMSSFDFKNGDSVIVTGTPKYYVKGGKLNFNVIKVVKNGVGDLYQQFLELKNKLEKLGYFDTQRKKPLPNNIKRIGVVTSKEGAVIQDIINVRNRRNPYIDIVLYPVRVQGINAEKTIAEGIKFFNNYDVDLIIVARGGGSFEDLQPFNTETVANAIYESNKFVLSAVGHETDFTICDFVSDLRAPTPSVASELCCANVEERKQNYLREITRLKNAIYNLFIDKNEQLKDLVQSIIDSFETSNNDNADTLIDYINRLKNFASVDLLAKSHKLDLITSKIQKLDPNEILKLGYSVVKSKDKIISSVSDVSVNDNIYITLKDGELKATVLDKEDK